MDVDDVKAASARVDAMEEIPGATAILQGVDDGDVAVDTSAGAASNATATAVTAPTVTAPTATASTASASAASASAATATTASASTTTPRGNTPVIRPPTLTCLACARSIPIAEVRALLARSPTHASMEEHALLPYDVDDMYFYNPRSGVPCCETCSHAAAGSAAPGKELVGSGCGPILRMQLTWNDITYLAMLHLDRTRSTPTVVDGRRYYQFKADICAMVDREWWPRAWKKQKSDSWGKNVAHVLAAQKTRYISGKTDSGFKEAGWWALVDPDLRPSLFYDQRQLVQTRPPAFDVLPNGLLGRSLILEEEKPATTAPSSKSSTTKRGKSDANETKSKKAKAATAHPDKVTTANAATSTVSATSATAPSEKKKPTAKRGKKVDTREATTFYRDLPDPAEPVRISKQPTHSTPQSKISEDGMSFHIEKGYRMAKASHGVTSGNWYFEITVAKPLTEKGNLRIGWSQISGDLQGPAGFDGFSYSYRGDPPSIFHASRGSPYGCGFKQGDVVGVYISLPEDNDEAKPSVDEPVTSPSASSPQSSIEAAPPVAPCDPLPEPWRQGMPYIPVTYYGPRPKHAGSEIRFFVNGVDQGVAFRDLYKGKYHPSFSSYMGGSLRANFGAEPFHTFGDQPPLGARAMSERYAEAVEEERQRAVDEASMVDVAPEVEPVNAQVTTAEENVDPMEVDGATVDPDTGSASRKERPSDDAIHPITEHKATEHKAVEHKAVEHKAVEHTAASLSEPPAAL